MAKMTKLYFRIGDTLQVIRKGITTNDKIEENRKRKVVQTYTYSKKQFEYALQKIRGMEGFFSIADTNCLDCPYNSYGMCYTHKPHQYMGFRSMLRSIIKDCPKWEDIPEWDDFMVFDAIQMAENTYVRFGTYGEPSLHPLNLIQQMSNVCENWTGYTHQWMRHDNLAPFFMASTHDMEGEKIARESGYRSFIATSTRIEGAVNCPASKEMGYKSSCSKCGLCAGTSGTKAKKSIFILNH